MVLFDSNFLLLLIDGSLPAPPAKDGTPIIDASLRIQFLASGLHKSRVKIVIPTPVLSEVLVYAARAGSEYFTKITRSSAFRIESFDERAAVELALLTAAEIKAGRKVAKGVVNSKLRFDRQIISIAKVNGVGTIYSDDTNLVAVAQRSGIRCLGVGDIPSPPQSPQLDFWERMSREEASEGPGQDSAEPDDAESGTW